MKEAQPSKEFIDSLPILTVKIGNEPKRVRYDPDNKIVYQLDSNDDWSGKMGEYNLDAMLQTALGTGTNQSEPEVKESDPPGPEASEETAEQDLAPCDAEESASPANVTETPPTQEPETPSELSIDIDVPTNEPAEEKEERINEPSINLGKALIFGSILGGIIIIIAICIVLIVKANSSKQPAEQFTEPSVTVEQMNASEATETYTVPETPTDPSTTEVPPSEPEYQEAEPVSEVNVLCPSKALIPGQIITEDIITTVGISNSEYRQISASIGLYTEESLSNIIGLVATEYIAAETFLTFDNLGKSYAPLNPWTSEDNSIATVTLPISPTLENLVCFCWGNAVDLTITVETKQTNTNETDESDTPPEGMEHESSVVESMVVDTYKLQNIRIKDVLDAENHSLYTYYMSIASIPSGFQKVFLEGQFLDSAAITNILPCFLEFSVSKEQADVLSKLDPATMTITISNPTAININIQQNDTYNDIQEAISAIVDTWQSILEAEKNGANEK